MSKLLQHDLHLNKALTCLEMLNMTVDWAELVTIDLSKFDTPGGKEELVKELEYAVTKVGELETSPTHPATWILKAKGFPGFFYVKNFNIKQDEVDRQFALGREFYNLPLEEKLKYHNSDDLVRGEYNGYRPAGHRM